MKFYFISKVSNWKVDVYFYGGIPMNPYEVLLKMIHNTICSKKKLDLMSLLNSSLLCMHLLNIQSYNDSILEPEIGHVYVAAKIF